MQLTFREIEKAFEIEEKTLYQWLNSYQMPAVKADGQYYFNSVEVLEWALKNQVPLTPGALALCQKGVVATGLIMPALTRGGVHFNIAGNDAAEVLGNSLDLLPLPEHISKSTLKEMLLSREQLGATGIGEGIAVPHVKHPVVLAGLEPIAGLFFLNTPVDFCAIDGAKVDILFMIMCASFKTHLAMLSRLAFCLQQSSVKAVLKKRADVNDIIAAFQLAEAKVKGAVV